MKDNNDFEPPKYWELLSTDDQYIYKEMHFAITAPSKKRPARIDNFKDILDAIDIFEKIKDNDKWKRCLVCGIFKINDMIAVNINQLKSLIMKCKSSINGSLKRIGYGNIVKKANVYELLFKSIPFLKKNPSELRKWTMRYYTPPEENNENSKTVSETSDENTTNENSDDDSFFSIDSIQFNDNLSLSDNENNTDTNDKNDHICKNNIEKYPQRNMTEPETELEINQNDNSFYLEVNNNIPSIFDDDMHNSCLEDFDFDFI